MHDAVPEASHPLRAGFHSGPCGPSPRDLGIPRMLLPGSFRPGYRPKTRPLAGRVLAMMMLWGAAVAAFALLSR